MQIIIEIPDFTSAETESLDLNKRLAEIVHTLATGNAEGDALSQLSDILASAKKVEPKRQDDINRSLRLWAEGVAKQALAREINPLLDELHRKAKSAAERIRQKKLSPSTSHYTCRPALWEALGNDEMRRLEKAIGDQVKEAVSQALGENEAV